MHLEGICSGNLVSLLPELASGEGLGDFLHIASLCHDPSCVLGVCELRGMSAQLGRPGFWSSLCMCKSVAVRVSQEVSPASDRREVRRSSFLFESW